MDLSCSTSPDSSGLWSALFTGGVRWLLHQLELSIRQPWNVYRRDNPLDRKRFFEDLERELLSLGSERDVVEMDESTVRIHPTLSWYWAFKGEPVEVLTWGTHEKAHIYATVSPFQGELSYRVLDWLN